MDNTIDLRKYPFQLADDVISMHLYLEVEPVSKARPRFTRSGHVYTPKKTSDYEEYLGWRFKEVIKDAPDGDSLFGIRIVFCIKNRKRIDIDNLAKAVLDAANGIIWEDDRQVRELTAKRSTDKALFRYLFIASKMIPVYLLALTVKNNSVDLHRLEERATVRNNVQMR